ncbi:MAG: hypothetical protein Q9168_002265 [Polycauliona sp. 1 TL-2023]
MASDASGLDTGAFGLAMDDSNHFVPTGDMSAPMVERPQKPPPPPKRAHLDEIIRLTKELQTMREEKAQAEEMTDMMGQDLQLAQEAAEKNDEELKTKGTELLSCSEELQRWKQSFQKLASYVEWKNAETGEPMKRQAESDSVIAEEAVRLRDQLVKPIASLTTKDAEQHEAASRTEEELLFLRKEVHDLRTALAKKDDQIKSIAGRTHKELRTLREQADQLRATIADKDAALQTQLESATGAVFDKFQLVMHKKEQQFETTLAETEKRHKEQVMQEQELRRTTEATLHATREELGTASHQEEHTQNQQSRFETTLRETEDRLNAQVAQEQELRRTAEAALLATREEIRTASPNQAHPQTQQRMLETTLKETQDRLQAQLAQAEQHRRTAEESVNHHHQERHLRQVADATLRTTQEAHARELSERTAAGATFQTRIQEAETQTEDLVQQIHALESQIQDQRKACDYFKKNSERLSREVKDTDAARRALEQAEYVARRQAADSKAQVATLQQTRRGGGAGGKAVVPAGYIEN